MAKAVAKPSSDAYVGMLFISLLALILGSVLLFLDYSQYSDAKPPPLPKPPEAAAAGGAPAPAPIPAPAPVPAPAPAPMM